jgi:chromosome segregation ATPase
MPDSEVESILREIREQVHADEERNAKHRENAVTAINGSHSSTASNGQGLLEDRHEGVRIDTQLSTIARAWDRLPPVVSDRRGWAARLELWIKGQAKNAMRWFTWEQVNFNAAVHHALKDTQEALTILEQRLESVRTDVRAESEAQLANLEAHLEARQAAHMTLEQKTAELNRQVASLSDLIGTLNSQGEQYREEHRQELAAQLAQFVQEVRERNDRLVEEQRVCFKQLSLETSETVLMLDRTRRDLESRLDKLTEHPAK